MPFTTEFCCVLCEHPLTDRERFYSHGRCPHCGYKHPQAGTIVQCTEHAVEVIDFKGRPDNRLVRFLDWCRDKIMPIRRG